MFEHIIVYSTWEDGYDNGVQEIKKNLTQNKVFKICSDFKMDKYEVERLFEYHIEERFSMNDDGEYMFNIDNFIIKQDDKIIFPLPKKKKNVKSKRNRN